MDDDETYSPSGCRRGALLLILSWVLTIAAILFLASLVVADERDDICEDLASYAEALVTARQGGLPLTRVMELTLQGGNEQLLPIVGEVYSRKVISPESFKQEVLSNCRQHVTVVEETDV